MEIWEDFRNEVSKIAENDQFSGRQLKDMLFSVLDYAEFELRHRENMYNIVLSLKEMQIAKKEGQT